MNYGLKKDIETIQKSVTPLNGTIVIVRAGKITLAEKVSTVAPKPGQTWSFVFFSHTSLPQFKFLELIGKLVGQVWSCLFSPSFHLQVWTQIERSWLPFMGPVFLASGSLTAVAKHLGKAGRRR